MKPLFHGVSSDHRIPKYRRNQKQNCHTNQIHVGLFSSPVTLANRESVHFRFKSHHFSHLWIKGFTHEKTVH